jgi:uncharacterized protein
MYFIVFASDKPGHEQVRVRTRPEHRLYLRNHGKNSVVVRLGGPTRTADARRMNGTLLVVEAPRIEDVLGFVEDDPYSRAQLFESVVVRRWDWSLGAPKAEQ